MAGPKILDNIVDATQQIQQLVIEARPVVRVHTQFMGRRPSGSDLVREHGRQVFAFLVDEAGFNGPEMTPDGLAYTRRGLRVELWFLGGHEPEVTTWLGCDSSDGYPMNADLHCLYVACGCGPPNALPGSATNQHTTIKRVQQHAAALREVLPFMTPADTAGLIARCHRRQLPDDWRDATHRPRPGPLAGH